MSSLGGGRTVDLIVVGYGGAGAAAAITARDSGAEVLLFEKAEAGGGSTLASGGNIRLVQDVAGAVRHFHALTGDATPEDVVTAFTTGLAALPNWLTELGAGLVAHDQYSDQALGVIRPASPFPDVTDADALGSRIQVARAEGVTGGEAMWSLLERNVEDRGIEIHYGTAVSRLCTDQGRVVGVEAQHGGDVNTVRARQGVVLACGGFSWGDRYHVDLFGAVLPSVAPPGLATGDGIRLAQQVGADLWHMTALTARYGLRFPGYAAGFSLTAPPSQSNVLVDQTGRRYLNEAGVDVHSAALSMLVRDPRTGQLSRLPSYMIFDETTRLAGPIGRQSSGANRSYRWSDDNSVEVDRGWIKRAPTITALGELLALPVGELDDTVALYDTACESGGDEFRRPQKLMAPLATAPFYAVPIWPVILNTQGGPRRDAQCRVLDGGGQAIPGLFSAGELGSLWGPLYPGASNLSEALITGQVAAKTAAAEVGLSAGNTAVHG